MAMVCVLFHWSASGNLADLASSGSVELDPRNHAGDRPDAVVTRGSEGRLVGKASPRHCTSIRPGLTVSAKSGTNAPSSLPLIVSSRLLFHGVSTLDRKNEISRIQDQ